MNEEQIEQEIQDKGLTAPRVTPDDIADAIKAEYFFTAANGLDGADIELLRGRRSDSPLLLAPIDDDMDTWKTTEIGPLRLITFCVLILRNGFTVTGESACVSQENFDADLGRKIARKNAVSKVWPLMGYALKDRLFYDAAKVNKGVQA